MCFQPYLLPTCMLQSIIFDINMILWQYAEDVMHTIDLGIWVHMLHSFHFSFDAIIRQDSFYTDKEVNDVWGELSERLQSLDRDDSMFQLNSFKGNFMLRIKDEVYNPNVKHKTFQAWEHQLLMQVQVYYLFVKNCFCMLAAYL